MGPVSYADDALSRAASGASWLVMVRKMLLGACPRTVISSRRREIFCLQVTDFTDFSLRYTPFEMTKEAFSDKLLVLKSGAYQIKWDRLLYWLRIQSYIVDADFAGQADSSLLGS